MSAEIVTRSPSHQLAEPLVSGGVHDQERRGAVRDPAEISHGHKSVLDGTGEETLEPQEDRRKFAVENCRDRNWLRFGIVAVT